MPKFDVHFAIRAKQWATVHGVEAENAQEAIGKVQLLDDHDPQIDRWENAPKESWHSYVTEEHHAEV